MNLDITGLTHIEINLRRLFDHSFELIELDEKPYKPSELITDEFISSCSNYTSTKDFIDHSNFDIHSLDELTFIDRTEVNKYVGENSVFETWDDLVRSAKNLKTL